MVGNRNQPTYTNEEINHNKRYESNSTGNEIESVMEKNNKIDNHNIENNINNIENNKNNKNENNNTTNNNNHYKNNNNCYTSTLLVFNSPKSLIISCVLQHYEIPNFINCLEKDQIFGGSDCIKKVFFSCLSCCSAQRYFYGYNLFVGLTTIAC